MNKKIIMAAVFAALFFAVGCGKEEPAPVQPPVVKYQRVSESTVSSSSAYAGTVRGRHEANLAFQAGGQILSRAVQLGDHVAVGDVLMTIDPKDIAQKVSQAEAATEAAQAQLKFAEANYARYQKLYEANAVSAMTLDQYRTGYEAALAGHRNAAAQLAQAENALSYTELRATGDGVVAAIHAEAGQVVGAGTPVLTIVETGELEIEISVPESKVGAVAPGKSCTAAFWALGNVRTEGTVREVAPMADPVARTYKVRVSVPNPPAEMALGMTASVEIDDADGAHRKSVVLPMAAIYQTGDTPKVWVVGKDNTVTLKSVSVEQFDSNRVRVTGLTGDDVVVIAGVHRLQEGQEVRLGAEGEKP